MATLNIKLSGVKAAGTEIGEATLTVEYSVQEVLAMMEQYPALIDALMTIANKETSHVHSYN